MPTSTAGQTHFSSSTTAPATSGILVGVTSGAVAGAGIGSGGVEINGALYVDTVAASAGAVTFGASCASGTTASCAIVNGGSLDPNGGVIWAGYGDGSNNGEFIKYAAATSTTITTLTRAYWGSTAATHSNTEPLQLVVQASVQSTSTTPWMVQLQNGTVWYNPGPTNSSGLGAAELVSTNQFFPLAGACFSNKGNNKDCILMTSAAFYLTNDSNNSTAGFGGNNLLNNIATQSISTTATLTALTNVTTPQMNTNATAAAAGTGGVLTSHCQVIWNQATGGTISFAVHLSAAVTRLDVTEVDYAGAGGIVSSSFVQPNITASGTGAAIGTVTPSGFGTTFFSDITLKMNPGTTNSPTVQLYAETSSSSDTLTIEPGSGCTAWQ